MGKKHFRFDVVIGNPPYQTETLKTEDSNTRQKPVTNIFQLFQEEADKLATNNIALIYPGGRWIHQFGKGCREFGQKQINDTHLQEILFYPDANEFLMVSRLQTAFR